MTFASFEKPEVQDALDQLASTDKLAVFVGAGVSAEAGMPAWSALVRRLLTEAGKLENLTPEQAQMWAERTIASELPPAAAGIAQTLLGKSLPGELYNSLYRPRAATEPNKPVSFQPGPTAHAIAALRLACNTERAEGGKMKILTTNYDDLLERALLHRDDVAPDQVTTITLPEKKRRSPKPKHQIKVHHLHGFMKVRRAQGDLILTDTSYYSDSPMARSRTDFVKRILSDRQCLFVGTSFADPNLMRFALAAAEDRRIRASDEGRHVAVLTHHSSDPPWLLNVRERVIRERLADTMIDSVFLDHFGDVSQFVWQLRNRIRETSGNRSYAEHAQGIVRQLLDNFVRRGATPEKFQTSQDTLSRRLREKFDEVRRATDRVTRSQLTSEHMAATVWLLDESGKTLAPWIATDRSNRDPSLVRPIPVEPASRSLPVRAVCEGVTIKGVASNSRWLYSVAIPLEVTYHQVRACVGAVSVGTLSPQKVTGLDCLPLDQQAQLMADLHRKVADWLEAGLND